jgi:hypothetical protein
MALPKGRNPMHFIKCPQAVLAYINQGAVTCDIILTDCWKSTNISEEHVASIFSVEFKQETERKPLFYQVNFEHNIRRHTQETEIFVTIDVRISNPTLQQSAIKLKAVNWWTIQRAAGYVVRSGSSVGIATGYGWTTEGAGVPSPSKVKKFFFSLCTPTLGLIRLLCNEYRGKVAGAWSWSLASKECRLQGNADVHIHPPYAFTAYCSVS